MPGTNSELSLSRRKEIARSLFIRGYTNVDVAEELNVHPDTVSRYRAEYEDELESQARENPQLLQDVLLNTIRALEELEELRKTAWDEFEETESQQRRTALLNTLIRIQDQRSKLFGLFGVKAEFFSHVQNLRIVQQKLVQFMERELCAADKQKLERMLMGEDMRQYMSDVMRELPSIDVEATVE